MTSTAPAREVAYQPALDGIRAIAIGAVLLFHGGSNWLPGGFLGVDVFFTLSGYLITSLLIAEFRNRGGEIRLPEFYGRRLRRLFPALFTMLVVTLAGATFYWKDVAAATSRDFPWALTGLSNWWFTFRQQSYFEAMGRPPLFQHTWSLAVEIQFYWVWPILLAFLMKRCNEWGVLVFALACAVGSGAALQAVSSPSHAYFGTDTHSFGLFFGAALAAASRYLSALRRLPWFLADLLGVSAVLLLVFLFQSVGETTDARYRAGLFFTALASAALIASTSLTAKSFLGKALSLRPLRWLGERSYSIYVWHWPVFQTTRPGIDVQLIDVPNFLLRLGITVSIAEVSYRFIETPIRRGAFSRLLDRARSWNPRKFAVAAVGVCSVFFLAGFSEAELLQKAISANGDPAQSLMVKTATAATVDVKPVAIKPPAAPGLTVTQKPAMVLGDSVLLGVSPLLQQQFNVVLVDAVIGRQAGELRSLVGKLAQQGNLPSTVILNIGNNGVVDERTMRSILDDLKPCDRVVVVNAKVPKTWQDQNNALIGRVVPAYPNAVVADWLTTSTGHPEYFWPDGVHANPRGAQAFTDMIVAAAKAPHP